MTKTEVDFGQECAWWDSKASDEDADHADEDINRLLRWRVIDRQLDGVRTVLEVGGGTGAFSIGLAQRGFDVTHVDFSPRMLDIAMGRGRGMPNLHFHLANAADLSDMPSRSADLVLNMDGAISFCGSAAETAIAESCRVCNRTTIMTVSNRAWMAPIWLMESIEATGRVGPAVAEMFETGFWHKSQYPENGALVQGYMGTLRAFLSGELRAEVERNGLEVTELRALGSLANLSVKILDRVRADPDLMAKFLDLCEMYDKRISPDGPRTRQRAGLLVVANRRPSV